MAQKNNRNLVEWAMHYRQIVIMITCVLIAFGCYGLYGVRKNGFPDITIQLGVVVAVCPETTAGQVEQEVTKQCIFARFFAHSAPVCAKISKKIEAIASSLRKK